MLEENRVPLEETLEEQVVALEEQIVEQEIEVCAETFVGGTRNYERLENKPSINDVELIGNKTSEELGLASIEDLDEAINDLADQIEEETSSREAEIERIDGELAELGEELNAEVNARTQADTALENSINGKATIVALTAETTNRENADIELQNQIDAITSKSDVVDIVGTYAQLLAHETASLGDNDIIKVLNDETHENAPSYYRWNKTASTWRYVGSESVAYTKGEADERFVPKTRTVNGKALSANVTLTTNDLTNDSGYLVEDDLAGYVKNTDYSTATTAGVVRDANCFLTSSSNGGAYAEEMSLNSYNSASGYNFIGKGTLENVLNNRKYLMPEYTLELPTTGKDNKLYLTPAEAQPDVEKRATGKEIVINDASEANLVDWEIKGDTEQDEEPNPEYSQEVKTVTGRNTVTVAGKNLFDKDNVVPGIPDPNTGEIIRTTEAGRTTQFIRVNAGDVYTCSGQGNYGWTTTAYYDNNKSFISRSSTGNGTFTVPANTYYMRKTCSVSALDTVQVERGSVATSYQPYTKQEVEINLGKNLFNKNNANVFDGYVSNTASNKLVYSTTAKIVYIPCLPNATYSISKAVIGTNNRFCIFTTNEVPANNVVAYDLAGLKAGENNATSYTITTSADAKYICAYVKASSTSADETQIYATIQIERGSEATSYAEYFEPIELCKLGDYQDRIFKDGNEWKVERKIGKWTISEADTGQGMTWEGANHRLYCSLQWQQYRGIDFKEQPDANIPAVAVSNRFLIESFKNLYTDGIDGFALSTSSTLSFRNNAWSDGETAKAEIVGTVFYYAKNTPTVITIDNQDIIDQLDALEELTTQSGYNLITTDTANVLPILDVTYFRPDPTVTKDEWLWVENHYEKLGGERKFTHNLVVNHRTAQGHWDYAFTITGNDSHHYTQLAQVAYYLFKEHAGLSIPVSGTYTEGSNIYFLTKITASSLGQVTIEMRKLSDGSVRTISTGSVPVIDTIS